MQTTDTTHAGSSFSVALGSEVNVGVPSSMLNLVSRTGTSGIDVMEWSWMTTVGHRVPAGDRSGVRWISQKGAVGIRCVGPPLVSPVGVASGCREAPVELFPIAAIAP